MAQFDTRKFYDAMGKKMAKYMLIMKARKLYGELARIEVRVGKRGHL